MSSQSGSMEPFGRGWKPRGIWAWLLAGVAVLLAIPIVWLAYNMLAAVTFFSPGGIAGTFALLFPLHLLLVTVVAGVMAFVSRRRRANLAMWVFGGAAVLAAAMALIPTFAILASAREYNAPVSLANYLANATHLNHGLPQTAQTVVFGTAKNGEKLELDVWSTGQPKTGPLRPAVVFLHGGGWVVGNRSARSDWNRWLNQLGYEVFDVEYRMPPPVRWQDEVGDVKAAVGWVAARAADYHVDPTRISIMGESAGGNLALLAAYSMGHPQLPASTDVVPVKIRSVISLYGPTEMTELYRTSVTRDFVQDSSKKYLGGTPEEFPDRYRAVSPLYHINAQTPPTISFHGTSDNVVPVDQTRTLLDQALSKAGVAHETYILPGHAHGFDINFGSFGAQIARAKIQDFLQRH